MNTPYLRRNEQRFRIWESVGKWNHISDESSIQFKVISYNVLAQYLLESQPYLFKLCTPENLDWDTRAMRLYDEILNLEPDIFCLQEVQESHINSFYSKFEQVGYTGVIKKKTGQKQDGCAIYFKNSVFQMLDHIKVEFSQPGHPYLHYDNVGVALLLKPHGSSSSLVVATTHLLFNPKRDDVRLAQTQLFLSKIKSFAYYDHDNQSGHHPIILAGDLNALPHSAAIKLLSEGHVDTTEPQESNIKETGVNASNQHVPAVSAAPLNGEDSASTLDSHSENPMKFLSVYTHRKENGNREATTFHRGWVTVDYIFFYPYSTLKLLKRFRLPTVAECRQLGPLPNHENASNHLLLAAHFKLKVLPGNRIST